MTPSNEHFAIPLEDLAPEDQGVILAILEALKVLVDQELEIDLRAIAVPVQNADGRVIAAMNVGAQGSRTSKKQMIDRFLPALRDTAIKMRPLLIG